MRKGEGKTYERFNFLLIFLQKTTLSMGFRRDNPLGMLGEHSKSLQMTRLGFVIYKLFKFSPNIPSGLSRR